MSLTAPPDGPSLTLHPQIVDRIWRVSPASMATKLSQGSWSSAPHLRLISFLMYLGYMKILRRVIINMPPGHGKTQTVSEWTPAWLMEMDHGTRVILASYGATLAEESGKNVRGILTEHRDELTVRLRQDSQASDRWRTTGGGGMWTAGIDGTVTGRRASALFIDDPHKNFEDSHSLTRRDRVYNFYRSTARNRLLPGGFIAVVHCLAGDQRVAMADGTWRRIDEIRTGDLVMSLDGDDSIDHRKVLDAHCSGVDETFTVATDRLALTGNARHPVLVVQRQDKVRPNLVTEWRTIDNLAVGDIVVCPTELPGVAPCPVDGWDTTDRAWLLGFLFGDGWVTRWERRNFDRLRNRYYDSTSWAVCAAIGVDEPLNARVADALEEAFGRRPTATKARYFRLDHNEAGRTLDTLGLHPKVGALAKRVPDWVFGQTTEYQQAFLHGLLDADGTKPKRGNSWVLGSGNPDLVEDARLLALSCGVRPTTRRTYIQTRRPPNSPEPVTSPHVTAGFVFDPPDGHTLITGEVPAGFRLERIRSIEPAGRQPVYDLTVDGTENFVAEGLVVHNTRWHEDDLTGRLLEAASLGSSTPFVHVRFPAIAEEEETIETVLGEATVAKLKGLGIPIPEWHREEGQALWPRMLVNGRWVQWYDEGELADLRIDSGEYIWNGLYQQRPSSPTGSYFPVDKWQYADAPPSRCRFVRRWDLAATETTGDATAGALVAYDDVEKHTYIVEVVVANLGASGVRALVKETAERDRETWGKKVHTVVEQEPGSSGKALAEQYVTDVLAGFSAEYKRTTGDKEVNATPLASQQQISNVFLCRQFDDTTKQYVRPRWWGPFIEECRAFPNGTHDDQVDAASHGFSDLMDSGARKSKARIRSMAERLGP